MKETRFKDTEIGRIPEDWEISTLVDLCSKITDGSHESPKETDFGYFMPSVKDMTTRSFDFSDCKVISENDYLKLLNNGCQPQKDDVLIAKDGSILKYSFAMKEELPIVILSSIAIIRPLKSIIDSEYLALYFRQPWFIEKVLADYKTGTGVPRIVLKNFAQIKLSLPNTLYEQTRIASALTSIDNLISSLNKLIEKKKNIKQGTMQQLLTGKKRLKGFSMPWTKSLIKELYQVTRGYVLSMSKVDDHKSAEYPYPVYSSQTKNNGIAGYYSQYLYENAITWTTDGANAGDVKYRNGRFYCTNVCGVLLSDNGMANLCMAGILGLVSKSHVSYVGNPKLMNNTMASIEIYYPTDTKEQTAISEVLIKMTTEISALESKKAKYEQIKQGMMQQLLTGKIRLV